MSTAPRSGTDPAVSSTRRLDVRTIVDAGLELAHAPAAKTVTVRQLGTRLGTDPTAIYRHFRSKDDLMRALLDRILIIAVERNTATPTDWKNYLRQVAQHTLDVFLEYPVIGAEAMRLSSEGDGELSMIESILEAFASAGLSRDERTHVYGAFTGFVLSFSSGIVRARQFDPDGSLEPALWIDRPLNNTSEIYPRIAESREALLALRDRDIYSAAVEFIIDGVSARRSGSASDQTQNE